MKIHKLIIENFKSIERIELVEPNPFTVFVGPNGSGKSNIFEALEFVNIRRKLLEGVISLFGGLKSILPKQRVNTKYRFEFVFDDFVTYDTPAESSQSKDGVPDYEQCFKNFSRIFIGNERLVRLNLDDDQRLLISARNLEKVLKRVLIDPVSREEIFEWLDLFVPGFKAVEVDDRNELHWFEQSSPEYFTKDLISDGTYNLLALLTAVYQSDEPQFLCIEEPENGLHPEVIMTLVEFFRKQCEEKGHYIWLNTHSTSVVSKLNTNEIVLVEKKEGATVIKQVGNQNLYDLDVDYAWLSGALGGGLPW